LKRIWILLVISLVGVGLFTACSSNADTMVQPSPSPSVSPSASPMATATDSPAPSTAPTATDREANGTAAGVNTVEDAQRVSDQVSEEVEKLSELKSAEAVVMGTIAVVGVEYDAQYQGGLTDRLKEMITDRVQAVDKSIVTVHVKDGEADYQKLMELREKLSNQDLTFEQLQTQVLNLAGNDQDTTVG
jgi:YhcN/YlaJ family sporulation lipoprotein